jgi:hypothetical protein
MTVKRVSRLGVALMLAWVCASYVAAGVQAAADDVTGSWAFVMETPGGQRTADATFQVEGKNVTGTWGPDKYEVKGTFADGTLDLAFRIQSENGPGMLGIKAKLANDELAGEWTFQEYGGTLKATRRAPVK